MSQDYEKEDIWFEFQVTGRKSFILCAFASLIFIFGFFSGTSNSNAIFICNESALVHDSSMIKNSTLNSTLNESKLQDSSITTLNSTLNESVFKKHDSPVTKIGRAVQQECRDRSRMPSSA
eukprot:TRINITY_DN28722_c0_g1_i1.p1 TRINITY_DN28722_c0_g1~~TRINITY_DN28722_c0_g1_i1.p1  ORF type:complete len:121 (-),score=4.35 TRINITY_DN28722_c0_g1_i1:10-372(-)